MKQFFRIGLIGAMILVGLWLAPAVLFFGEYFVRAAGGY